MPLGQSTKQVDGLSRRAGPGKVRKARARRGQIGAEQVVAAAARLFREKGYHGTSMQDIGDAVGLHKGSLYPHIRSKDALLFQVIGGALQILMQQVEQVIGSSSPPYQKLRDAVESLITCIIANTEGIAVFLESTKYLSPARRQTVLKQQRRYEDLIQQILEEGIQAGQFRRCDTKMVCYGILGMCDWIYRWYSPKGRLTPAELGQVFSDFILNGLALPGIQHPEPDGSIAPSALSRG